MVTYFNKTDMVDFGNFMLHKAKIRMRLDQSNQEVPIEDTLEWLLLHEGVSHADFANWKHLVDTIKSCKQVVDAGSQLSPHSIEFLEDQKTCEIMDYRQSEVSDILLAHEANTKRLEQSTEIV